MKLFTQQSLEEIIKNRNLYPVHLDYFSLQSIIVLKLDNIEDFLKIAIDFKVDKVFYSYTYYSSDVYIIDEEQYDSEIPQLKTIIKKHNDKLSKLDFERPSGLHIFILYEGSYLGFYSQDIWLEEMGFYESDIQSVIIEGEFKEKNVSILKDISKRKTQLKEELREKILNEEDFKYKKNQDSRYRYLVDLLVNSEEYAKYSDLLQPFGMPSHGNIKLFMDETWLIYQEKTRK